VNLSEVFLEEEIADSAMVTMVRQTLPSATFKTIDRETIRSMNASRLLEWDEPRLLLAKQRGRFLRLCPGYQGINCCSYFILNVINGCPFTCTYCALGALRNSPFITAYTNLEDLEAELDRYVFSHSSRIHRVGTGQFSDSLALDTLLGISPRLVDLFAKRGKGFLELKSKSGDIEHLKNSDHRFRTIVSFSLSLPKVIQREEGGSSLLGERLEAAATVQSWGYRVGLHFDPLVDIENWSSLYGKVLEMIGDMLLPDAVVWVSLGTLRLDATLLYRMREMNPETKLDLSEFISGYDRRWRYLPETRRSLYGKLARGLRNMGLPVYLCMEAPRFWRDALGWEPKRPTDVKDMLDDWALHRWPKGWG